MIKVDLSWFSWYQKFALVIFLLPTTKNLRRSKHSNFLFIKIWVFGLRKFLFAGRRKITSAKFWHRLNRDKPTFNEWRNVSHFVSNFCSYYPYYHKRLHQYPDILAPFITKSGLPNKVLKILNIWDDISISWWNTYQTLTSVASVEDICKCKQIISTFRHSVKVVFI